MIMQFYDVIDKRRTIREFSPETVPEEKTKRVITAGLKAPTYNHLREWDFILIKDESVRHRIVLTDQIQDDYTDDELQKTFGDHDPIAREMYINAIPKQKRMILTAPEVMIVIFKPKTRVADSKRIYDLNCLASVWCCVQNILLAMAEEDLYGVTFVPKHTDNLKVLLRIPDELEIASIIPFGFKADHATPLRQKEVDLSGKIHLNKW
jgi:nitroreductase